MPVLLQLNAVECGPACLAMILNYFGHKISVAECRDTSRLGEGVVTARMIAEAARQHGIRVRAFSVEPSDLKQVQLPAIAHWDFRHFVVVERWSPGSVTIVDPASGRRRLSATEFDASFTGVVLSFEPGARFVRKSSTKEAPWRIYLRSMLQTDGAIPLLAQILGASVVLLILGLGLPILTKMIVDRVLPDRLHGVLSILGVGLLVLLVAQTAASYLRSLLLIYLQGRMDMHMMLGFFESLLALPFRFFEQRNTGDLLMRLGSNATIREILTNETMSAVLDGALVAGYVIVLLLQSPLFGLFLLVIGALQLTMLAVAQPKLRDLTQRDLAARADSQNYMVEALAGISTLKAYGIEDLVLDHWSNLFSKELNASVRRDHVLAVVEAGKETLHTLLPLALLWVGALEVLRGAMSLGTMLALVALAAGFLTPFSSLLTNAQRLQLVGAHLERLNDVVDSEPEQDLTLVRSTPSLRGSVEVRDLGFRYSAAAPLALRNVSLTISRGQKVALIGRSGSGKSTLIRLLLGLYEPSEGVVLYDGGKIRDMNYRILRRQLGVVLQEPFLFSGTIRENIAFAQPGASLHTIIEAARIAEVHEEIAQFPMQYETRIGEGGIGLSGGQRQRLALARGLVRKPTILVLDEATSHLDVVTEAAVDDNLSRLPCTRIIVAHRLSTIRNADQIFVMEAGEIVERGTHDSLLALGGRYAVLVNGQLERPVDSRLLREEHVGT
ncbi:MAG: peptidase domain-containing ABC transporter [Terriglobales bacterium]